MKERVWEGFLNYLLRRYEMFLELWTPSKSLLGTSSFFRFEKKRWLKFDLSRIFYICLFTLFLNLFGLICELSNKCIISISKFNCWSSIRIFLYFKPYIFIFHLESPFSYNEVVIHHHPKWAQYRLNLVTNIFWVIKIL